MKIKYHHMKLSRFFCKHPVYLVITHFSNSYQYVIKILFLNEITSYIIIRNLRHNTNLRNNAAKIKSILPSGFSQNYFTVCFILWTNYKIFPLKVRKLDLAKLVWPAGTVWKYLLDWLITKYDPAQHPQWPQGPQWGGIQHEWKLREIWCPSPERPIITRYWRGEAYPGAGPQVG